MDHRLELNLSVEGERLVNGSLHVGVSPAGFTVLTEVSGTGDSRTVK